MGKTYKTGCVLCAQNCGLEVEVENNRIVNIPEVYRKISRGPMALCPVCMETYPAATGIPCLACQGESPYVA